MKYIYCGMKIHKLTINIRKCCAIDLNFNRQLKQKQQRAYSTKRPKKQLHVYTFMKNNKLI